MTVMIPAVPGLAEVISEQPHPLLFVTVSGAHLYGFPSKDSDVDLRGVHLLPAADLAGLRELEETHTCMWWHQGTELDLVSHDLRKFARLMLRRNGYVLEQLLSPLVVHTTPEHEALAALAPLVFTSSHAHHYRGFAKTQEDLFSRTGELKPLLYAFRALLTGIHLMRSGTVQAHLPTLLGEYQAPGYLPDLIAAKASAEHAPASGIGADRVAAGLAALHARLDEAESASELPVAPGGFDELNDLLVSVRLGGVADPAARLS
ncbi:nucleotidyltransferase domain-containing protein [Longispora albida]|uniref:nucleotidyltransferase domain-containing protein n=1 Tax=Longispora albida TaxID=203523 RepID=UPI003CCC353A